MFQPGRQSRVVDQQVDTCERSEVPAHFVFAAYVECKRRTTAACGLDFVFERREPFCAASRRDDVVSFRREPERRGASDARCGACNQCLFFHFINLSPPRSIPQAG